MVHQLLGNGFMALFEAPLSFGNDAADAVHAVREIVKHLQQELRPSGFPPLAEVLAGTVGSAVHKEYKVTGDVVNRRPALNN